MGDEKLNKKAQSAIVSLTNSYHRATSQAQRNAIHKAANQIRNNKKNIEKK